MTTEEVKEVVETPVTETPEVNTPERAEKPTVRQHIKAALEEVKERQNVEKDIKEDKPKGEKPTQPASGRERDESGKFSQQIPAKPVEKPVVETKAPDSWKAEVKAEWAKVPPAVQAEIARREADMHKTVTSMDAERAFAKEMQTSIMPYMPLINMSQSTPAKAVTELLNYAQILQTGSPQAKGQLLWQLAQRWQADMQRGHPQQANQPQNVIQNLQGEIAQLKTQLTKLPEGIKQQQEEAQLKSIIDAFSADPKNVHYERVKGVMAALLSNGVAKDMQDAYDRACYADPEIRSTLEAVKSQSAEAKRVADIKAKAEKARNASVSVKGSGGAQAAEVKRPKLSLREEIRANLRASQA